MRLKFPARIILVLLLALQSLPEAGLSQSNAYGKIIDILYYGRVPGARVEAMGRAGMAASRAAFAHFYNPAATSFTKGFNIGIQKSGPFFIYRDAEYEYTGLSLNKSPLGAVGFSRWYFESGPGGVEGEWKASVYTISYSFKWFWDIFFGFSLNNLSQEINTLPIYSSSIWPEDLPQPLERTGFYINTGLTKIIRSRDPEAQNWDLRLSAFFRNPGRSELAGSDFNYWQDIEIPSVIRVGAAFRALPLYTPDDPNENLGILAGTEYYYSANYDNRNGMNHGLEISLYRLLSLRCGYFYEKTVESSSFGKTSSFSAFTYGFGVDIPLDRIPGRNIPLKISLDYARLKEPAADSAIDGGWAGHFSVLEINVQFFQR